MKRWVGRVRVMPRQGLLDPQGTAVEHALSALGFGQVKQVRVGRTLEIAVEGGSEQEVRARLKEMCDRLIANPVTEDYMIDAVLAVSRPNGTPDGAPHSLDSGK
jgi:phosphoribosylformylglycinamidine synthase